VTQLRDRTRDKGRFPLVFEENCNYGYRRNLWGMKPLGVLGSLGGVVVSGAVLVRASRGDFEANLLAVASVGTASLLLLGVWILVVRPWWIRIPAEAYAERLLESCESLP